VTQTLAGFNQHGIIMAADSRVTRIDDQGGKEHFSAGKLFPLGRYAGVVSGGSGVSIPLSINLCREVRHRGLLAVEDIVKFAVPYLSEHYEAYLRKNGSEPEEELRRLNFIISGYSLEGSEPYGIYLLESEKNALPFKVFPARTLLVMPRNLGMERRFLKALTNGACLYVLTRMCQDFLKKVSGLQDEIGPPFSFASITPAGYRSINLTNQPIY
jgi:hypothetical protein